MAGGFKASHWLIYSISNSGIIQETSLDWMYRLRMFLSCSLRNIWFQSLGLWFDVAVIDVCPPWDTTGTKPVSLPQSSQNEFKITQEIYNYFWSFCWGGFSCICTVAKVFGALFLKLNHVWYVVLCKKNSLIRCCVGWVYLTVCVFCVRLDRSQLCILY
jgi:hypothetical protein